MGVREIGRKSEGRRGGETLGIGLIREVFHWLGTVEEARDLLKRMVRILEKRGAESLRNQEGRESGPGDVALSVSRELKIDCSEMGMRLEEEEGGVRGG